MADPPPPNGAYYNLTDITLPFDGPTPRHAYVCYGKMVGQTEPQDRGIQFLVPLLMKELPHSVSYHFFSCNGGPPITIKTPSEQIKWDFGQTYAGKTTVSLAAQPVDADNVPSDEYHCGVLIIGHPKLSHA